MRAAVSDLAGRIISRYKGKNPLFVSLLNGGPVFSTLLMMEVERRDPDFCPDVCYLNIETYGVGQQAKESVIAQGLPAGTNTEGRLAVVLDEVLDSGVTMKTVEEYLYNLGVAVTELVVLVQKERERELWPEATMYGLKAPDKWLGGMGMNGAPGAAPEAYRFASYVGVIE